MVGFLFYTERLSGSPPWWKSSLGEVISEFGEGIKTEQMALNPVLALSWLQTEFFFSYAFTIEQNCFWGVDISLSHYSWNYKNKSVYLQEKDSKSSQAPSAVTRVACLCPFPLPLCLRSSKTKRQRGTTIEASHATLNTSDYHSECMVGNYIHIIDKYYEVYGNHKHNQKWQSPYKEHNKALLRDIKGDVHKWKHNKFLDMKSQHYKEYQFMYA